MSQQVTFSTAPLATIDIAALKSSRFMVAEKRLLPYRDETGAVNLALAAESKRQLEAGEAASVPAALADKLLKFYKHAVYQARKHPVSWERRTLPDGRATWHSSNGETRREVRAELRPQPDAHAHKALREVHLHNALADAEPRASKPSRKPASAPPPAAGACRADDRKQVSFFSLLFSLTLPMFCPHVTAPILPMHGRLCVCVCAQRMETLAALAKRNGEPKREGASAATAAAEAALAEERYN